jgi:hypothetical protein
VLSRVALLAERWFGGRPALAALVAVLLSAPTIAAPLFTDDVLHRLVLDGLDLGLATRPSQLYAFIPRDAALVEALVRAGRLPWWTSSDLALNFLRPLSSALLRLDHWLAPWNAPLAHVHSLAWTFGLVLATSRLHRRLCPSRPELATLLYALSTAFIFSAGWIAARHAVVTATFSVLAVDRWLDVTLDGERRSPRDELLGALFFLLALASGEGAAGAPLFFAVLTFARPTSHLSRARRLAAPFSILVVYFALYTGVGGGARGSGGYLDPIGAPVATAGQVVLRSLAFVTDCYLGLPCDAAHGPPLFGYALIGALLLAALLFFASRLPRVERRAMLALVGAGLAASLPGTLGFYGGRVLLLSLVASSAVVTLFVEEATKPDAQRALVRFAGTLAFFLLGLAPLLRLGGAAGLVYMAQEARDAALRSRDVCPLDGPVVFLAASDPSVATYSPIYLVADGASPEGEYHVLTMAAVPLVLTRTAERSLRLTAAEGSLFVSDWERLYRRDIPDALSVELPFGSVRWSEEEGAIDYRDESPAHWAESCFMRWDGHAAVRVELPAVGERLTIPWAPGPMGM